MAKQLRINGEVVGDSSTTFAYDGCHKIYLIVWGSDRETMQECGYGDDDIFPVSELPEIWAETCPLRFISSTDLTHKYVEQCEDAEVTYS